MKYNLIRFSNGKFGVIRKRFAQKTQFCYRSFGDRHFWGESHNNVFFDCRYTEKQARIILEELRNPNSPPTYEVIE